MHRVLRAPPWANLWRVLVTTLLFGFMLVFAVAFLSDLDEYTNWPSIQVGVFVLAYFLAAIVVWSDDIPWPGD